MKATRQQLLPVVTVYVDKMGGVDVLQTKGVIVAVVNELNPDNRGAVLPIRDQEAEIMELLRNVPLTSEGTDAAEDAKRRLKELGEVPERVRAVKVG